MPSSSERILFADLNSEISSVHVIGRVVHVTSKEISVRGENRTIFYGIFEDESGSVSFTAWKDFEFEKGDVIDITNAYTKEWQGEIKLNLGDRTKIEKTDSKMIPEGSIDPKELKVKDLRSGLGTVEVIGSGFRSTKHREGGPETHLEATALRGAQETDVRSLQKRRFAISGRGPHHRDDI